MIYNRYENGFRSNNISFNWLNSINFNEFDNFFTDWSVERDIFEDRIKKKEPVIYFVTLFD